ncbi:hypothetical protein BHE74_00035480 [Ensete ventricosum]|nr:hypothetical protein GW17_00038607 [Ensete ventricosum]RWW57705.1 hypothetical protein BHE74_00035480 [Ensete ventricosum]RZR71221.1 hypothetical protein BHM03_00004194 [Ensete ventricosum]
MEPTNRKRRGGGGGGDDGHLPSRPRPSSSRRFHDRRSAATDDEVEEFFAILRRTRDALRCLGPRPRPAPASTRWSPEFAWEDFAGPGTTKDDDGDDMGVTAEQRPPASTEAALPAEIVAPMLLDLNADPDPESLGSVSPHPGAVTAPGLQRSLDSFRRTSTRKR